MLGVFYYPWSGGNPEISQSPEECWLHWRDDNHNPPKTWASNYIPILPTYITANTIINTTINKVTNESFDSYTNLYSSKDINIIKYHLSLMKKTGINFVISSWWGQNDYTDQVLELIFKLLSSDDNPYPEIKFCIYYEKESKGAIQKVEIIDDINYIKNKYAISSYYLKIDNRPIIFTYTPTSGLGGETHEQEVEKWRQIRDDTQIYTSLKVFDNYQNVINSADSWHQYAPAIGFEQQGNYSAFVSPGFHRYHESPRLTREDFVRFENDVARLASSAVPFKFIQTWNEWGECTGIEPAQEIIHDDTNEFFPASDPYDEKYIDILAKYFNNTINKYSKDIAKDIEVTI